MKYLSLFTGIGGFELGIQQAYENNIKHASVGKESKQKKRVQGGVRPTSKREALLHIGNRSAPLCIGYSEIDKYAVEIYQKHFKEHKNYGDITKIKAKDLPDFDLLVGGFPCQAFSIAGKRAGFDDTRGTLFFDIARILDTKRPKLFLLENVKGLLSHDGGRTFRTIIATLDELGYDTQWQVLNSKNFGVPQNRERVFIAGHLRGEPRPEVFPFLGSTDENSENVESTTLDANYWKGPDNHGQRTMIVHNIYGGFKESKPRTFEKIAPTIRTSAGGGHIPSVLKNNKVRRLTPVECERLQSFPDNWTAGLSDTQRYKTLGNAVTVNVVQAVMERLLK